MHFNEVLTKKGAGNSSVLIDYNDKDLNPFTGVSYYRLKQVDFNGSSSLSDIVPVMFNQTMPVRVIWLSNDAQSQSFKGFLKGSMNEEVFYSIIDMQGRLIFTGQLDASEGIFTIPQVPEASGVYSVRFSTQSGFNQVLKVVK